MGAWTVAAAVAVDGEDRTSLGEEACITPPANGTEGVDDDGHEDGSLAGGGGGEFVVQGKEGHVQGLAANGELGEVEGKVETVGDGGLETCPAACRTLDIVGVRMSGR